MTRVEEMLESMPTQEGSGEKKGIPEASFQQGAQGLNGPERSELLQQVEVAKAEGKCHGPCYFRFCSDWCGSCTEQNGRFPGFGKRTEGVFGSSVSLSLLCMTADAAEGRTL